MKVKSLLTLVSCSLISLSLSAPSIAEAIKDSKVKTTPNGIGNKQRSLNDWFYDHSTKPLDFSTGSSNSTQGNESTYTNGNENTTGNNNTKINGDGNTINDGNYNGEGNTVCQEGSTCHINNSSEVNENPFNSTSVE